MIVRRYFPLIAFLAISPLLAAGPGPQASASKDEAVAAKPETKDAIRDLRLAQLEIEVSLRDNELAHEKLEKQDQDFADKINDVAKRDAEAQKVDTAKFFLDVPQMMWIARPREDDPDAEPKKFRR